jgi:hypothetical protein
MEATYRQVEINQRGERIDQYLTGNPEISFFKQDPKRYYPYARNTRSLNFDTAPNFGVNSIVKLSRYGDLIGSISLEIDLPELKGTSDIGYCNNVGHALIEWIELEIGGNQIVRLYGEWLHINREISNKYDQRITHRELTQYYDNITPNSFKSGKVIVPIPFWFTDSPGLFLPLSAICRHDVIVRVKFHPLSRLWISDDGNPPIGNYSMINCNLLVDYYVLDEKQKKIFAPIYNEDNNEGNGDNKDNSIALYPPKIKYTIQQVQQLTVTIPARQNKYKLDLDPLNFSVGYLVWVFRRVDVSTTNDWFNFSNSLTGNAYDPMVSAKIYFGEKERTDALSATNLRLLESFKAFGNASEDFIYSYFFNLYPNNKLQASGSVNLSSLKDVNIVFDLIQNLPEMEVQLYAINYNIFNIEKGQGWLQYLLSN